MAVHTTSELFISKSKFLGGLQCHELLWHAYNARDLIPEPDEATKLRDTIVRAGSIVTFNASFEMGRLKECCEVMPNFSAWLKGAASRHSSCAEGAAHVNAEPRFDCQRAEAAYPHRAVREASEAA